MEKRTNKKVCRAKVILSYFQNQTHYPPGWEFPYSLSLFLNCKSLHFWQIHKQFQYGSRGQNECHLSVSVLGNISTTFLALSVGGNISTFNYHTIKCVQLIISPLFLAKFSCHSRRLVAVGFVHSVSSPIIFKGSCER